MTLEEAEKVAKVCERADNGCQVCVEKLTDLLNESFPEFNWKFLEGDDGDEIKVTDSV